MLWVLWPISSISRVHSVRKHSSAQRMAGVRMPEKSENGRIKWYRTYFCNFLLLFLLVRFITAAHFLNQQPESDLCLPMHLLHLIISKLSDVWGDTLKPVFKLKCPCWNPDCPSKSNVSLHFQLKAQSLTAPFKPVSPSRLRESASLKSCGTANSRKTARTIIQTPRMHVS